PQLQRDILEVIERYMNVGGDSVDIKLERGDELSRSRSGGEVVAEVVVLDRHVLQSAHVQAILRHLLDVVV
ncbi:hypothetical protein CNY89_30235, partial [Amaricoccus sp. HAR-UPW-R2A-40]